MILYMLHKVANLGDNNFYTFVERDLSKVLTCDRCPKLDPFYTLITLY